MKPVILMDVDGVAADFVSAALRRYRAITHRHVDPNSLTSWDFIESLGDPQEVVDATYAAMTEEGACRAIPLFPGARDGVTRLREVADLYAVTAPFRGKHWMYERTQWLMEELGFDKRHVMHVMDKHLVDGEVLVEDKVSTLISWRNKHPLGHPIMFERSYNVAEGWDGVSARDWPQLVRIVERLVGS